MIMTQIVLKHADPVTQFVVRNAHPVTWAGMSSTAALWLSGHAPIVLMAISTAATVAGVVANIYVNIAKARMMRRWHEGKGLPPPR
jgi:hypothetical protein